MKRILPRRRSSSFALLSALILSGCTIADYIIPAPPGPIELDQRNYQRPLAARPLANQPLAASPLSGPLSQQNVAPLQSLEQMQSPAKSQNAKLYALAEQHERGLSVEKNMAMAFYLYLSAAEQNNVEAQIKVGEMLTRGEGIASNPLEGYKWWYIAAANNSARAKALINGEGRPLPEYDRNRAANLANAWYQVRAERLANSPATN